MIARRKIRVKIVDNNCITRFPCDVCGGQQGKNSRLAVFTLEDGLERLQTDYIDVYLVHYYRPQVPLEETMGAMAKLLEKKIVRAVGVSRYDVPQLEQAGKLVQLDAGPVSPQRL